MLKYLGFVLLLAAFASAQENTTMNCDYCFEVLRVVQHYAFEGFPDSQIKRYVKDMCRHLDPVYDTVCNVTTRGDLFEDVVEDLREGKGVHMTCEEYELCDVVNATVLKNSGDSACAACTTIVKTVERLADKQTSVENMRRFVKIACENIKSVKPACAAVGEVGIVNLIEALAEHHDSNAVCKKIELC